MSTVDRLTFFAAKHHFSDLSGSSLFNWCPCLGIQSAVEQKQNSAIRLKFRGLGSESVGKLIGVTCY